MLKKISLFLIHKGVCYSGSLLLVFYISLNYGVEVLGQYSIVYSILLGLGIICRFGSETSIIKLVPNFKTKIKVNAYFRATCTNSFVHSILIVFTVAWVLLIGDFNANYMFMFLCLPLQNMNMLYASLNKAKKKANLAPYFENGFVSFLATLVLLFYDSYYPEYKSEYVIFIAYFFSMCVTSIAMFVSFYSNEKRGPLYLLSSKYNRSLWKGNYNFFFVIFTNYCLLWVPIIILSLLATAFDVGAYSIITRLAFIFNFILIGMTTVTMPYISEFYFHEKYRVLEKKLVNISKYMSLVGLLILALFVLLGEFLLDFFTERGNLLFPSLLIVSIAQVISLMSGSIGVLMSVSNLESLYKKIVLVSAVFSLFLNIALVPFYGVLGSSIAFAVGIIIQNLSSVYYSKKHNKLNSSVLSYFC